jgi:hypothetical protein
VLQLLSNLGRVTSRLTGTSASTLSPSLQSMLAPQPMQRPDASGVLSNTAFSQACVRVAARQLFPHIVFSFCGGISCE